MKAPDVKFVLALYERRRRKHLGESGGMPALPGHFSNRTLRNAVSSVSQAGLEFTQVLLFCYPLVYSVRDAQEKKNTNKIVTKKGIKKLLNVGIKVPDVE